MIKATLFAALLFAFTAFQTHAAENVHGVLRVVKGDVQIKSAKDGQKTKARLGGKVFPQDTIITGKDARVKIVMTDNNEINISPDSQMIIQNYVYNPEKGQKDVLLNVIYGKVRSKVEQKYDGKTSKFQVKTPSAVAGVRGTDFMASFNNKNGSTQVVTFKGKVEFGVVGPKGNITSSVMVQPGQTSTVAAGQTVPQTPTEMPKEQLAKADSDTKAEDRAPAQQQQAPAKEETNTDKDKKEEPKKESTTDSKKEGSTDGNKDPNASENKEQAKQEPKDAPKDAPKDGTAAKEPAKADGQPKSETQTSADGTKSDGQAKSPSGSTGGTTAAGTTPAKEGGTTSSTSPSGSGTTTTGTTGTKAPSPGGTMSGPTSGPATSPGGGGMTAMPGREPSSMPSGSMLNPSDLPSSTTGPVFTAPTNFQPFMPPMTELPRCDFCNSVIQNGSQKITIKVQTQ